MDSTTASSDTNGPTTGRKMRVLCLHGIYQSGAESSIKTRALRSHISEHLQRDKSTADVDVEYSFPNGFVHLDPALLDLPGIKAGEEMYAWSLTRDGPKPGEEMTKVLSYMKEYIEAHGPFDGIVAFSQGAAVGLILTSWLECIHRPERRRAAAFQPDVCPPLPSNQGPLKFAVLMSGYRGDEEFWRGLYEPRIRTPVMFVKARHETIIPLDLEDLAHQGVEGCRVVVHGGGHHVPTERRVLQAMAAFVKDRLVQKPAVGRGTVEAQEGAVADETSPSDRARSDSTSMASIVSTVPSSLTSVASSASKGPVIRKRTRQRKVVMPVFAR